MNIGIVMPQGLIAGAERVLIELLRETPTGMVTVLAPPASPLADEVAAWGHDVARFELPKKAGLSAASYAMAAGRALADLRFATVRRDFDLIHAFLPLTVKVAAPAAIMTRRPLLVSVHDITSAEAIGAVRSRVQRCLVTSVAARVVAVSEYVARTLASSGYPRDLISVIHNGVATPHVVAQSRSAMRRALGVADDALIFAVIARMTPWKGQAVAVEAFEALGARIQEKDAHLVLAGGPFEVGDESYAADLRNRATRSLHHDRIHFLGYQSDPGPVYAMSDVILVPSTRPDPFPTVVLEAGALGRPVVVTALGGGREAVVDGLTGFVAQPDATNFGAAMAMSASADWRAAAGPAAERHISSNFSARAYAEAMHMEWQRAAAVRRWHARRVA